MSLLSLVLAAACGSSGTKPTDATTDVPKPIDAPPDMAIDASAAAPGGHYHYVIDSELLPQNTTQAQQYGLDLNNDGMVDNQLGMVLAAFAGMGFDSQTPTTTDVNNGTILMLADVQAMALTDATGAMFTVYVGTNPTPAPCNGASDTTCRHHLQGTGMFDVAATPQDTPLAGDFASGTFTGGPGHLPVQLAFLGSSATTLDLIGARVKVTANVSGITQGVIAGGVSQTELDTKVYPNISTSFNELVALECSALTSPPACGCTSGSAGATLISLFDTNHDCSISVDEIENNTLIQSLFAPDVTLENQKCISLGVGFTAVPGEFTSP